MIKHARILVLAAAAVVLVAAATAQARTSRAAATVAVTAGKPSEFGYKLSTKTVAHGTVTFTVTNAGAIPHTFKLCSAQAKTATANTCAGHGTANISPGAKATLKVTIAKAGTYEYLCTIAGHAAGGMKGILKVT
jgi:plastocyanin